MKKVLVIESGTMMGHMVRKYLEGTDKFNVFATSFPLKITCNDLILDISDKASVEQIILSIKPDILINCAGVLIEESKSDSAKAIYLNAFLPHYLSKILHNVGGKLIHISTDCVFSGKKGGYKESDFRDSEDMYGRSKALGEINNNTDITIRTSKIGPELEQGGEELFHWFLTQKGTINGYTRAFWSGVTTLELSKGIEYLIENNISGLIHFTNGIPISKYDLLNIIREIWNLKDIIIRESEDVKIDRTLLKSEIHSYRVPTYVEMLTELKEFMDKNMDIYRYNF